MGIAYLGIGLGGAAVPWISNTLVQHFGWQAALRTLGVLIIVIAFPMAFLVKEAPGRQEESRAAAQVPVKGAFKTVPFYLLALGSMGSIAAGSGAQQDLKTFLSLDPPYPPGEAARILSLVVGVCLCGRLPLGWAVGARGEK